MQDERRSRLINGLGFDSWVHRDTVTVPTVAVPDEPVSEVINTTERLNANPVDSGEDKQRQKRPEISTPAKAEISDNRDPQLTPVLTIDDARRLDIESLRASVSHCHACELHKQRKQVVVGSGNAQASLLIIGEAPGEQEDLSGEPFVGRAGLLLNNMLAAIGLDRERVFITNVVKCRPPNNRDPRMDELSACSAYLHRQVELIAPSLILVVGRIAAQHLLETSDSVAKLRGKTHRLATSDIPLVVTYHPAYLLRKPQEKQKVWDDLKFALSVSELDTKT